MEDLHLILWNARLHIDSLIARRKRLRLLLRSSWLPLVIGLAASSTRDNGGLVVLLGVLVTSCMFAYPPIKTSILEQQIEEGLLKMTPVRQKARGFIPSKPDELSVNVKELSVSWLVLGQERWFSSNDDSLNMSKEENNRTPV